MQPAREKRNTLTSSAVRQLEKAVSITHLHWHQVLQQLAAVAGCRAGTLPQGCCQLLLRFALHIKPA